ncbi:TetR/AcrR family transcriptional regulator [Nioella sp. MMSF_3534]|uniref:TetR/AcrR family transcriptional regulator n=1 Tax=Nioella sp. MMSF_3534 TaxID=3046720 RepID=UPI00274020DA|nr:TetR/AcrR family transcriptional regulator [Nioella sp. MMSF_3534]
MTYVAPRQGRAIETEAKFLEAAEKLFAKNGFNNTTIDHIACAAGLHRGAFLKRFGSKYAIADILFERYCSESVCRLNETLQAMRGGEFAGFRDMLIQISVGLEMVLRKHIAANRAFNEILANRLEIEEKANNLFRHFIQVFRDGFAHFSPGEEVAKRDAIPPAQLLVVLNYNYVLEIAPSLPREHLQRHNAIVDATLSMLDSNLGVKTHN